MANSKLKGNDHMQEFWPGRRPSLCYKKRMKNCGTGVVADYLFMTRFGNGVIGQKHRD